jgi:transcriptional regulator with XRE-family HTH domain
MGALGEVLGHAVRARRQQLGWSQERLAEESGLDRTYISGIERATRNPTLAIQERIASALGTTVAELLASGDGR